jgi:hypothetical protein
MTNGRRRAMLLALMPEGHNRFNGAPRLRALHPAEHPLNERLLRSLVINHGGLCGGLRYETPPG